jgi:uncharacterized membrane protein
MKKLILKNWVLLLSVISLIIALPGLFIHGFSSLQLWQFILIVLSILLVIKFGFDLMDRKRKEREERIDNLDKQKKIEKEQKAEEERKKIEEKRRLAEQEKQARFYKLFVSLANDVPISEEDLVYLSKNLSFPNEFPITKLVDFDFKKLFFVSDVKRKILWRHELKDILVMYNSFYECEYTDKELRKLDDTASHIYHLMDKFKDYDSYETFKGMVKGAAKDMAQFYELEESKI